MLTSLRRFAKSLGLDRTVAFGSIGRVWQLASSPFTALLIVISLTPTLQGYYFTFSSILGVSIFFELGFSQALIQFAAHEWAFLGRDADGKVVGETRALHRLASIARFATAWYGGAAVIYGVGVVLVGLWFFAKADAATLQAWILYCIFSAADLFFLGWLALLEGSGEINRVYFYRMVRAIVMNSALWGGLLLGLKLWSLPLSLAVALVWTLYFLASQRRFLRFVISQRAALEHAVSWGRELFPLQWRIALSWMAGYFAMQLFTPVLFRIDGPVAAGQMGMSWSVVNGIANLSAIFVTVKMPTFGGLIARGEMDRLDRLLLKTAKVSVLINILGCAAFGVFVWTIKHLGLKLGARVLDMDALVPLLLASICTSAGFPLAAYMRAHKQEPLYFLSIATGVLVTITTIAGTYAFGAAGATMGYLLVTALVSTPMVIVIFLRCRSRWHGTGEQHVGAHVRAFRAFLAAGRTAAPADEMDL